MPEQLGRYLLHERLGKGGMSEVFRATLQGPMGFAKDVAVKRVSRELTEDRENVRALVNEARIGALLRHRNVVEVFELDQADDAWYVAMELVRGKTLWELLHRCRSTGAYLPRTVALAIAEQVADGLHYAHNFSDDAGKSIGLVHRDLKPANVMVSDRGVVKIMDFGIARSSMRFYKTSLGGPLKGTPLYMAPEQMEGIDASSASDVFSLTVMLYEMLTNARVFLAPTTAGVIERLTRMDLTPFLQPIAERDPELGHLLRAGLQRLPHARIGSAEEFRDRVAQLRGGSTPTLDDFVRYLQMAPRQGLIQADQADLWQWKPPSDVAGDPPGQGRQLAEISRELQHFGTAFLGPVLFPDSRERELDAARRSVVPHYGSFDTGARDMSAEFGIGPAQVDTGATTHLDAPHGHGSDGAQTQVGHEPVDPATLSLGGHSKGWVAAVGCLILVAVGLMIVLGVFVGRPRFGADDLDRYTTAVGEGDWTTAAAIAARATTAPEKPEARLVLALDAALAGQIEEARSRLGDPSDLPLPLGARGHVISGGLHRKEPSGYRDAADSYAQALDCTGAGCEPIVDSARAGLAQACAALEGDPPAACSRAPAVAWSSGAERSLVRSVVLLDDGHDAQALEALRSGLESDEEIACPGVAALRRWAGDERRPQGTGLDSALQARGREAARGRHDCQLFGETGR